jgi:hypothetical protein
MIISHVAIGPSILYLGTPVVLISTVNEDGTFNIAPMSSAWWLGWRCMLGLQTLSQTPQNMIRTGQCVLNLTSVDQVDAVNRLARRCWCSLVHSLFFFIHGSGSDASMVAGQLVCFFIFVRILGLMLAMPYRQILGAIIGLLLGPRPRVHASFTPSTCREFVAGRPRSLAASFLSVFYRSLQDRRRAELAASR